MDKPSQIYEKVLGTEKLYTVIMFKSLANSIGTHTHQVSPATGHGLCKTLAKAWEPGDMPRRKRTTFY